MYYLSACFQLSIDLLICGQAYLYRNNTDAGALHQPLVNQDLEIEAREPAARDSLESR